ncbi:MAG: aminodeoxychorismate/anthranilate synthase component II [Candidatus Gracilibacteria bacterium]|nr:aminodeoxychorismate/anthranilate synthase component II [Candidatus Gracilibacteria bacterium]
MILMIDNYDSFTYNLVQYFGELGARMKVFRNDQITLEQIRKLSPQRIVISPGPGRPEDAGVSCQVIKTFAGEIPILGVCLGHQAIGLVYGGRIVHAKRLMHGKVSRICHRQKDIFKGLPNPFEATRYHSLAIEKKTLPSDLEVTAWAQDDQEIMAVAHKKYAVWGVQFHPESILTKAGKDILKNFISLGSRKLSKNWLAAMTCPGRRWGWLCRRY